MSDNNLEKSKEDLLAEIDRRIEDKIIEKTNADLLKKLINNAGTLTEAVAIAELGTTYRRTGLHFDKRLEKFTDTIKYFKKNEDLSFKTDEKGITHKLIIGDNYDALLNLLIEYRGKIDVIYIDPPYGKDSMGKFAETNYNNAITRDNLLSMLYPRLVLAKQLLAKDGVIMCSIDDRNQAFVKCLFDEVFGESSFVCNAIWQKKTGASDAKGIATITEYILFYCNGDQTEWNNIFTQNYDSYDEKRYRYKDSYYEERGGYYPDNLDRGGLSYSDSLNYGIECPDGTITFPNGRTEYKNDGWIWKWSKEKVKWGIENGFIEFRESKDKANGWAICYKNYIFVDNENQKINRSAPFKNIITGILNGEGTGEVKQIFGEPVFKNPKPISLIIQLLKSIQKNNMIVLDFFAGSGTTGHAVLELKRNDPGKNIKFILVQAPEQLDEESKNIETLNLIKITKECGLEQNLAQVAAERLRRIMTGKTATGENSHWTKENEPYGDNLDVYDIGTVANFESSDGKTPFDVIDEMLYGKEKMSPKDKIKWVCENFDNTQKYIEKDSDYKKRIEGAE